MRTQGTSEATSVPASGREEQVDRPTTPLGWTQLFQISIFWFALNATWGGFELFQQKRVLQLVGEEASGAAIAFLDVVVVPIAILAMPVAGSISDYWQSRLGRRRPFILVGSISGGLAFMVMALVPNYWALFVCLVAMQLTLNIAKGPFAGLVPDVVPERQVGTASALMGLMIIFGLIGGTLLMNTGYLFGEDFTLPALVLGILVMVAGIGTALIIPAGPPAKDRAGRSWRTIALETFGTDILRERDYVFLLASRLFIMTGGSFFMNLNVLYLLNVFDLTGDAQGFWVLIGSGAAAGGIVIGTIPGSRLGDRIGRRPVIVIATLIATVAMSVVALAPSVEVAMAGVLLLGVGYGAFLAVDWALMTELIPRASAGRYMGLSNVVDAANGAIASGVGGLTITGVGAVLGFGLATGSRLAMGLAVIVFVIGIILVLQVREPRRAVRAPAEPVADAATPA